MGDQSDSDRREKALQLAYQRAADSYEAITEFRGKLLGLLPLATGISAFLLLERQGKNFKSGGSLWPLGAIGLLGFVVTVGLFAYELRGMQRCHRLERQACTLEERLGLSAEQGPFRGQPKRALCDMLGPPAASLIIYLATAFAWLYVAGVGFWPSMRSSYAWWPLPAYAVVLLVAWIWVRWWLHTSARDKAPTGWSNLEVILADYVDARRCRNLGPIQASVALDAGQVKRHHRLLRRERNDALPLLQRMIEGGYAVRALELAERGDHVVMTARGPGLSEICGRKLSGQISFIFTLKPREP